jgi:DUF2950 family protein
MKMTIMETALMHTNNRKLEALGTSRVKLSWGFASSLLLTLALGLLLAVGLADSSFAQDAPPQPKTFASAGEAANALFEAAQKGDEPALEAILGAGKDVTSAGDADEDKLEHEQFSQKYQEMHRLVREQDGTTILYIGAENWPFPIPLASKNGAWYFDSQAGKQEILFRRIGENEAAAIAVCEEFAMAKNDKSVKAASDDPITQFAESLFSGTSNAGSTDSNPFHGYYFRVVTDSSSGASNQDNPRRALKLVAYPAEYKSSGVMTFVLTRAGLVFEKDLGPSTPTVAPQMKTRTGMNWRLAESS